MIGIGGSPDISSYNKNSSLGSKAIEKLNMKVDSLQTQADLQEISFMELDKYFKDRKAFLASIPSIWPVKGWVTSGFGYRVSPFTGAREIHDGVDIAAPLQSYVISPADGFVIRSGRKRSLGLMMEIDHGYGLLTRYGHNSKNLVNVGDHVKRGQVIAQVGRTGRSTGPHLHYGIFLNGIPVNPAKYIID